MKLNNKLFYSFLTIGAVLILIPAFFTENQVLSGICCISGFLIFLSLNLFINKKNQYISLYLLFALAFALRFCRVFMTSIMVCLVGFAATFFVGIVIASFFLLSNLVNKTKFKMLTPLIFPSCYTLLFILLAAIHFGNTFNLMEYFTLITPLSYSLIWTDEFGLIFLILLAICLLIEIPFINIKKKIFNGILGMLIIFSLCISGSCLAININNKEEDYILQVALAISEKRDFDGNSETYMNKDDYHHEFENRIKEAVKKNADLIIFQEEYFVINQEDEEEELSYYSDVLNAYKMPALLGASVESESGLYKNCAYFFNEDGNLISTYQKVNVIPFIETLDYENGSNDPAYFVTTISGHKINISTVICFDINNDLLLHKMNPNTELLIVPSWDWDTGNAEQIKTYIRSIEYNTTVLKHSYDGYSYVSTPNGLYGDIIDNRGNYNSTTMIDVPIYKK